ncbi:MAG: BamA/TamA family outer membrane protein [Daejeonella sp.]|uniref:BamA/TamA family outer membrane protein n=1 Tax=Daejeonella sp. TaxID=2805397 RepID=UPI00273634E3|nr:BamA/TamA family outer membrane protein [Daejeonella sp.]MDP3468074.1 BamA/TamA family outer membrane protein [Daejeonella sp.]
MNKELLRKIFALSLLILISGNGYSQMKLIKKLLSNEVDTTRRSSFLPLPAIGYAQETGVEIGGASLYSFYTDRKDSLIRTSRIMGMVTFTTKKQSNFALKSDIWTPGNKYHVTSEIRYRNFPFNFYGIGNSTLELNVDPITQKLFKLNAGLEKKLGKNIYTGMSMGYESYRFEDKIVGGIYSTDPGIRDKDGGQVFFMGITQILDSRNTNTYTTKGSFLKLNYSYAPDFFGGDHFSGSLLKLDLRNFHSLSKKTTLGLNAHFQTISGSNTPFYLLPQLGSDEMMRAYYAGRFRDQNLLALQAELRLRLNPRFGLVGFAAAGNVHSGGNFKLIQLKPSVGGGFRYFYDIERGLSVRMDYAIGEQNPGEKRQSGFYLSLGEAF